MPHLKDNTDKLRRLLNAYEYNNGRKLAVVLGCSPPTAYSRIEHPEDLTVRELRDLVQRGHIPIDEIRGAL